jgi:hypothetical protein
MVIKAPGPKAAGRRLVSQGRKNLTIVQPLSLVITRLATSSRPTVAPGPVRPPPTSHPSVRVPIAMSTSSHVTSYAPKSIPGTTWPTAPSSTRLSSRRVAMRPRQPAPCSRLGSTTTPMAWRSRTTSYDVWRRAARVGSSWAGPPIPRTSSSTRPTRGPREHPDRVVDNVVVIPMVMRAGAFAVSKTLRGFDFSPYSGPLWRLAYWPRET